MSVMSINCYVDDVDKIFMSMMSIKFYDDDDVDDVDKILCMHDFNVASIFTTL